MTAARDTLDLLEHNARAALERFALDALREPDLHTLVDRYFGTDRPRFVSAGDAAVPHGRFTAMALHAAVLQVQNRYAAHGAHRLKIVLNGDTRQPKAYAIFLPQGQADWIVVNLEMLTILERRAARLAVLLQARCAAAPVVHALQRPPGHSQFASALHAIAYLAALQFTVMHEAGHHFDGHAGFGAWGTPPGAQTPAESMQKQALEVGADVFAIDALADSVAGFAMERLLPDAGALTADDLLPLAAICLTATAFLPFKEKTPRAMDDTRRTHPADAFRVLGLALKASDRLCSLFPAMGEESRADIALRALALALSADATAPGALTADSQDELAPLRHNGVLDLLACDEVKTHFHALHSRYVQLRTTLAGHARGPGAMKMRKPHADA
jgi:hypothetical protein